MLQSKSPLAFVKQTKLRSRWVMTIRRLSAVQVSKLAQPRGT